MRLRDIIDYYSREDVQQALLGVAKDREVVGVFRNGSFAKRPNTLLYPQDIVSMIRQGVMEFHCSLERWSQPMALRQDNYESLRTGWDLILDIDCDLFEHGKVAAIVFCRALAKHDIKGFSVKFSGGKGFHIGIPWESMPAKINYKPAVRMYPDLARNIAAYLKEFVREDLEKEFLKRLGTPEEIAEQLKKPLAEIIKGAGGNYVLDPYEIVDVDPVLISPRHLFRMPYSLHKSSFLVSLPLRPNELELFERDAARPERLRFVTGFLDGGEAGEAELLVAEAIDWHARKKVKEEKPRPEIIGPKFAVKEEYFPPCVQNIMKGLSDGRKRSLFIMTNFLSSSGWGVEETEKKLVEWNKKNRPPLRDNYIRTHVRWHQGRLRAGQKKLPPPGCSKEGYYAAIGVCQPDEMCGGQLKSIKNPVNYPLKKMGIGAKAAGRELKAKRKIKRR